MTDPVAAVLLVQRAKQAAENAALLNQQSPSEQAYEALLICERAHARAQRVRAEITGRVRA